MDKEAEDVAAFTRSLSLGKRELVIATVNDCTDLGVGTASGTHWSVLAYSRGCDSFFTYDSLDGRNEAAAKALAKSLAPAIEASIPISMVNAKVGQQTNSYDCGTCAYCGIKVLHECLTVLLIGAHACAIVRELVEQYVKGDVPTLEKSEMSMMAGDATRAREELADVISRLANNNGT